LPSGFTRKSGRAETLEGLHSKTSGTGGFCLGGQKGGLSRTGSATVIQDTGNMLTCADGFSKAIMNIKNGIVGNIGMLRYTI
jgi:hypothetical protein